MRIDEERSRLTASGARFRVRAPGLLGKVLTFAAGAVLVVAAFMVSLLVVAVVLTSGLLVGGYLWWKTRELRKQMRERQPSGRVIEAEVIRDVESHDGVQR
jgi:hypothetical protein